MTIQQYLNIIVKNNNLYFVFIFRSMDINLLNQHLIYEIHADLVEAEEDFEEMQNRIQIPFQSPLEVLNEGAFIARYRVSKDVARLIITLVEPYVVRPARASSLTIEQKVMVALRFFATGSYQEITGSNIFSGMSQASVSITINEITRALNNPEIFNHWVRFPTDIEEIRMATQRFFVKYGFPGIVGIIDCTHVAIVRPPNDPEFPEDIYYNRKRYHSINVQLICDHNLKIINVIARFPGSAHDSRIWRESNVSRHLERLSRDNPNERFFLIGDSGYPLRPWLMTPLRGNYLNPAEERFNRRLCSIRCGIERCNGVLKNRFRCLLKDTVLHYHPVKASLIINACVILHNMCIDHNVALPDDADLLNEEPENNNMGEAQNNDLDSGRALRNLIVEEYFQ